MSYPTYLFMVEADPFSLSTELRTGQLVKDETFTLFEAVGALEVGYAPPEILKELSR